MTMTVKLSPALEHSLRQRSAALGRPASALIREALQAYLDAKAEPVASAYELGVGVFGKYRGPVDLASTRKRTAADIWSEKHGHRATKARRG